MVIAVISYLAAIGCGVAAAYLGVASGDPIVASLMASVVFFAGAGVVLLSACSGGEDAPLTGCSSNAHCPAG